MKLQSPGRAEPPLTRRRLATATATTLLARAGTGRRCFSAARYVAEARRMQARARARGRSVIHSYVLGKIYSCVLDKIHCHVLDTLLGILFDERTRARTGASTRARTGPPAHGGDFMGSW